MFGSSYFPASYFGAGYLGRIASDNLVAADLTVAASTLGSGTLIQKHLLSANGAGAGVPVVASASLAQKHALTAAAMAAGLPTLSTPAMGVVSVLIAIDASAGSSILPALTFGQRYAFTAAFTPHSPTLGTGALGQKHVIASANFAVATLALPVVSFSAGRQLLATSMAAPSPVIGGQTLVQKHVLAAVGTTAGAPVLAVSERPLITRALAAANLAVTGPTFASVGLAFSHVLHAVNLTTTGMTYGTPPEAEEIGPPRTWFRCRDERWSYDPHAKWYDEDHDQDEKPVKQSIFTNLNDDIELTVSHLTLVGRTSPERGPSEAIEAASPLYLSERKLWIDIHQLAEDLAGLEMEATLPVLGGVAADLNLLNDKILAETNARTAADVAIDAKITTETNARIASSTTETNARTAADTALAARVTALETRSYVDLGGVTVIALASGFVYNVLANAGVVIINPATNISSGTFNLPTAPVDRQKIDFIAMKRVNTLTFATANGAHSLANPPTTIMEGKCVTAVFGPALSTWLFIS